LLCPSRDPCLAPVFHPHPISTEFPSDEDSDWARKPASAAPRICASLESLARSRGKHVGSDTGVGEKSPHQGPWLPDSRRESAQQKSSFRQAMPTGSSSIITIARDATRKGESWPNG
jgi:hypothetical protein